MGWGGGGGGVPGKYGLPYKGKAGHDRLALPSLMLTFQLWWSFCTVTGTKDTVVIFLWFNASQIFGDCGQFWIG